MDTQRVLLTAQESRGAQELAKAPEKLTTAKDLASTVPDFTKLQKGTVLLEFTERRGSLIFHVYHIERKRLVEEALQSAQQNSDDPQHLAQLDEMLTTKLEKFPWWDSVGERLYRTFEEFFREEPRVVFDPEVDSWSVIVRKPMLPTAWTSVAQVQLFSKLHDCLTKG